MAIELGAAYISILPTTAKLAPAIRKELGAIEGQSRRAGERSGAGFAASFGAKFKGLAKGGLLAGVAAGGLLGGLGVKTAADMEQAEIAFTTMLGSGRKAQAFIAELSQFAAKTPFDFPGLQTAASSLISAGISASDVIPIMTSLGNTTSGMGTGAEGIKRATVALQQMNAAGRITGEDLNQLRDAGIPVYDLLSKATGKSKAEVVKLAQAGKLGKKELDQMMEALKSGKGLEKFNGLMEKQSKSLSGMWNTLKDTIGQGMAKAITPLIPMIKDGLGGASKFFADALVLLPPALTAVVTGITALIAGVRGVVSVISTVKGFVEDNQTSFTILAGIITTLLAPAFVLWGTQATIAAAKSAAAWVASKAGAASSIAMQVAGQTLIALGWARVGIQAMLGAAKTAGAWVLSKLGAAGTLALYGAAFAFMAAGWLATGVRSLAGATVTAGAWLLSKASVAGTILLYGIAFALMAAGWIASGVAAMAGAVVMAAAWLVAIWPIALAIAAIALVVVLVVKYWDQIKAATVAVWNWITTKISSVVSSIIGFVRNNWPMILGILTGPIGLAVVLITKNFGKIKSAGASVVSWIAAIPGKLGALASKFGGAGRSLINSFVNGMKNAGGVISGIAGNVWNAVKGMINGAIRKINSALNFSISVPGKNIQVSAGKIPMLAKGGIVDKATLAIIGEAGPEAVVPLDQYNAMKQGAVVHTNQRATGSSVVASKHSSSLTRFVIENWRTGEGYFREIAEDTYNGEQAFADTMGRMG